jgi:hypothetical protein
MSDIVENGQTGMIEQPKRRGWSRSRGFYAIRVWKGNKADAPGKEAELRAALIDYETVENGPKAVVTATYGTDQNSEAIESPISLWERNVNRVEKPIYEFKDLVSDLSADDRQALRSDVQEKEFHPDDYDEPVIARGWFDLIMSGVESFILEQPVLVWSRTVSNNFKAATIFADTNVGAIITVDQMKTREGAPAFLVPDFSSGAPAFTNYGFRKAAPTISQQAGGKVQIQNQYEAGFWVKATYPLATY